MGRLDILATIAHDVNEREGECYIVTGDKDARQLITERVKVLQGGMLDRRVDTYLALRSKLTPEQWEKWRELRREMGGRFHRRGPMS